MPEPREDSDVATKKYVDDVAKTLTLEEALIKENGGYNIANAYINMNFNNIKNIGEPSHISDAATKGYVDNSINDVVEKETKHLIAATASYHGDLIKGGYQFSFGGSSLSTYKKHDIFNGFLVPAKGKIKKFVVLDTGFKFNGKVGDLLKDIVVKIGLNVPIPLFTLVLIKYKGEAIDIGTLNFMFTSYSDIGLEDGFARSDIDYVFKFNLPYTNLDVNVDQKDILNIRSVFSTIPCYHFDRVRSIVK